MFRKLNLKTLSIAFVALLVITIGVKVIDNSKGINTLKGVLFDLDQEQVTSVIVQPRAMKGQTIELKKEGNQWRVLADGQNYNGDASVITGLINQVNGLKPIRLAARDKDRWEKYELTDSLASVVKLMDSNGELARLYIGKFSYQMPKQQPMMNQNPYMRPQGTMTTYVRCGDDNEVYAVEGFLGSTVNRDVDAFRNKQLVKVNKGEINKITFEYPADSSFTIVKNENVWMSDGITLDSASVANYLSAITALKGTSFTNEAPQNMTHHIKIQTGPMNTIEVQAKLEDDQVILTSTQNPGSVFKENKDRNFEKLFISKQSLEK